MPLRKLHPLEVSSPPCLALEQQRQTLPSLSQNPATEREREDLLKIQQEMMTYSKSSKRDDLLKIQQEKCNIISYHISYHVMDVRA